MSIKHTATPAGAIEALQEGLQHAISNNAPAARSLISSPVTESQFASGAPQTAQNEVAPPFPVFTIDPQDIVEGKLLDAAKLTGWRFLILQADSAIVAATVIESEGIKELSSINEGRLVAMTLEALSAAELVDEVQGKDFELRYLEIRPLHFSAVWLHAEDENFLIPLEDAQAAGIAANTPQREAVILEMLQSQQSLSVEFPEPR